MKKITPQKFSERLAKYGALTVAIAGVTSASGQIIYTDIADVGGGGVLYLLDFDDDTIPEFAIKHFNSATTYYSIPGNYYNILACGPYNSTNAILGVGGNFVYPFALSNEEIISNGRTSWNNDVFQTMNFSSCYFGGDFWCANQGDKYLGLRFILLNGPGPGDDTTHYGWARIEVGATSSDWLIKDYAYNSTPDEKIKAGQKTLGIDDNSLSKIKIVALHKSIGLYNLQVATNYKLLNMTGQEVLKGTTENSDYVIEASTLASGVYIVELGDTKSITVFRKKVVLQ